MAKTRVYLAKVFSEAEKFFVSPMSRSTSNSRRHVVWVDLCAPTEEDMHVLAESWSLHELAIEDALGEHQRPKLDRYATHLFLSCHAVRLDRGRAGSR